MPKFIREVLVGVAASLVLVVLGIIADQWPHALAKYQGEIAPTVFATMFYGGITGLCLQGLWETISRCGKSIDAAEFGPAFFYGIGAAALIELTLLFGQALCWIYFLDPSSPLILRELLADLLPDWAQYAMFLTW
ncbi:hypothetical protein ACWFPY_25145 [Nocardia fluminea]